MIAGTEQAANIITELETLARERLRSAPPWLAPTVEEGIARFASSGFPTTRAEDWRFTNVQRIARTQFTAAQQSHLDLAAHELEALTIPGLTSSVLVSVNGYHASALSLPGPLPAGVRLVPMHKAIESERDLIENHLASFAARDGDAFAALNTAFVGNGALVYVEPNTTVDHPIQLLNVTTHSDVPVMTHPRNLILCGAGSRVAVVEHYVSLSEGVYLTNAVTQIYAGANAEVEHYLIEEEGPESFNVSSLLMHQQSHSNVSSHTVLLGGALVRNNICAVLDGEGCDCLINGLFIGSGRQHLDNFMRVEHIKPHCDSRQFYKGILNDKAHGVFSGRIFVAKEAQQTDAKQTNANLLLSDQAVIDTKPQLEIYADDVKCTHGATIGQIDKNAVFYLRSRGIDEEAARALVVYAFAAESFERMQNNAIRRTLGKKLLAKLPQDRSSILESFV